MIETTLLLRFVQGDATQPSEPGPKIIAHVCNDVGAWGKGFVLALARRWPDLPEEFKRWYRGRDTNDFGLGSVQFLPVEEDVWVANMVAQHGLGVRRGVPPIRYEALATCLEKTAERARALAASVHMPRIGCGLAGGDWGRVEQLVQTSLCQQGVAVTVYDLPETSAFPR